MVAWEKGYHWAIIQKQLTVTSNYASVRCEVGRAEPLQGTIATRAGFCFASLHFHLVARKLQNIYCFAVGAVKHVLLVRACVGRRWETRELRYGGLQGYDPYLYPKYNARAAVLIFQITCYWKCLCSLVAAKAVSSKGKVILINNERGRLWKEVVRANFKY
jgi:hypothetical protein